jgi:hypothetical protein
MRHPALGKWEERLKALLDEVDDVLETRYGGLYPLHPARKKRGQTANKEQDGLFDIGSSFSPGFGSDIGRGYIVTIDMVTLAHIQSEIREKIERAAVRLIREKLRDYFPERDLRVGRDGDVIKIYGDLSLGEA